MACDSYFSPPRFVIPLVQLGSLILILFLVTEPPDPLLIITIPVSDKRKTSRVGFDIQAPSSYVSFFPSLVLLLSAVLSCFAASRENLYWPISCVPAASFPQPFSSSCQKLGCWLHCHRRYRSLAQSALCPKVRLCAL